MDGGSAGAGRAGSPPGQRDQGAPIANTSQDPTEPGGGARSRPDGWNGEPMAGGRGQALNRGEGGDGQRPARRC
jgi:hypothetical protein